MEREYDGIVDEPYAGEDHPHELDGGDVEADSAVASVSDVLFAGFDETVTVEPWPPVSFDAELLDAPPPAA